MKKKLVVLLMACSLSFGLCACGSGEPSEGTTKKEEKIEYIEESQVAELFTSPDDFEGKYVKLSGQLLSDPEKSDGEVAFQVWTNPLDSEQSFIVHCKTDCSVKINDYVKVDGKIAGSFDGETIIGADLSVPLIKTETVEVSSYMDVMAPTLKEISPNVSSEQHGLTVSVDKIEYSDIETRLYMTITNKGNEAAGVDVYGIRIVQDGKQIEQDMESSSAYEGGYAELSYDVSAGASTSGVLVFPPLDQTKNFQVIAPNPYSDNYELEFKDYAFDITVQ